MGEISEHRAARLLEVEHALQSARCSLEIPDGIEEVRPGDTPCLCKFHGAREVEGIVRAHELQGCVHSIDENPKRPVFHGEFGSCVGNPADVGAFGPDGVHGPTELVILRTPDHGSVRFDPPQEFAELFPVEVGVREDVDVIPGNDCEHGQVRTIPVELRGPVHGGAEVFISFQQDVRGVGDAHHPVEAGQLRSHHEVGGPAQLGHHVEQHRGDGCLAVAASDHHSLLVDGRLVQILRIADHFQAQIGGPSQFGVVRVGVHAEDDLVESLVDAVGVPAHDIRKKSGPFEPASARVVDGVIRSRDGVAKVVQGEGEVVHGGTTDGDEVDVHGDWEKLRRAAATVHGMGPRKVARKTPMKGMASRMENTAPMPRSRYRSFQPERSEVRQFSPACS